LSKDEANKVFLPFYRTETTRKSKIEGVGLGLAVTRSIIEMHRGKLWAEPRPAGKTGGHFLFTLPL
jgi:signal transduction histidine kinase